MKISVAQQAWGFSSGLRAGTRVSRFDHAKYGRYNFSFTPSGPVAQLGARMNGIHEVTGSIPVWSTKSFFDPETGLK